MIESITIEHEPVHVTCFLTDVGGHIVAEYGPVLIQSNDDRRSVARLAVKTMGSEKAKWVEWSDVQFRAPASIYREASA